MEKPGKIGTRGSRPAVALPIESYTAERKAEFLLANAVDEEDYKRAKAEVARARAGSRLTESDAIKLAVSETRLRRLRK
jgi:hypothetical protein